MKALHVGLARAARRPRAPLGVVVLLVSAVSLLALPRTCGAQAEGAPAAAEARKVVVTGMGAVRQGDVASARDDAVADALRNAVEQVVGTMVSSETLVKNFALVEDRILSQTQGYVKTHRVLEEKRNDVDGVYEVRVEAEVRVANLASDLEAIGLLIARKRNPRLMVMFEEENAGEAAPDRAAEAAALKHFRSQGFTAVDPSVLSALRENEAMRAAIRGDDQAAREIGARQGAEVIVLGTGRSERATGAGNLGGLISCRATLDARAVNCASGEIIAVESATASGLDVAERAAGAKALTEASRKLAASLSTQILERWSKDVSSAARVRLLVSNIPDYATLLKVKQAVTEDVRGVEVAEVKSFEGSTAELEIQIKGDAQTLARELAEKNVGELGLQVVGVVADRVEARLP